MNPMRTALVTAAMAAPMLLGCGGQVDGGATVPGLPADFTGPGVYTVPADPTVTFAIAKVRVEQAAGSLSVYYDLPAEFSAQEPDVELTGTPGGTETVHLSGEAGTSTCTVTPGLLRCEEVLSGVRFDAAQAMAAGDPLTPAVTAFRSEPIGVLSVALPGSADAQ
jgi:hypothetical protein